MNVTPLLKGIDRAPPVAVDMLPSEYTVFENYSQLNTLDTRMSEQADSSVNLFDDTSLLGSPSQHSAQNYMSSDAFFEDIDRGMICMDVNTMPMSAIGSQLRQNAENYSIRSVELYTPPPEPNCDITPLENARLEKLIIRERQVAIMDKELQNFRNELQNLADKAEQLSSTRAEELASMRQAREALDKERADFETYMGQTREAIDKERVNFETYKEQTKKTLDKERAELATQIRNVATINPELTIRENSLLTNTLESFQELKALTSKLSEIMDSQITTEPNSNSGSKSPRKRRKSSR